MNPLETSIEYIVYLMALSDTAGPIVPKVPQGPMVHRPADKQFIGRAREGASSKGWTFRVSAITASPHEQFNCPT